MINLIKLTICVILSVQVRTEDNPNINPFNNNPGIYFENLGSVNLLASEWNLVVYFNLTNYDAELAAFQPCMTQLKELCVKLKIVDPSSNHCIMTTKLLEIHLTELIKYDQALRSKSYSRRTRSLIDAGGYAMHYVFGVLDQRSADKYDEQISLLQEDQKYLLSLIKNQTTILDSSNHIMTHNAETLIHQFEVFQQHLKQIDTNNNWDRVRSTLNRDLNSISSYIILLLVRFKDTQKVLLDLLMNHHNKILNPLVISPITLEQQLLDIQNKLPKHLTLPKIDHNFDIKLISAISQTKTVMSPGRIIMEIKLPLITLEDYQIFKLVPIPFKSSEGYVYITPPHEYLIVNLLRERYTSLDTRDFAKCAKSIGDSYVCEPQFPLYTTNSENLRCELELINHSDQIPKSCTLTLSNKRRFWIPIANNRFIYILDETSTVDLICRSNVTPFKIAGSGIIEVPKGCFFRDANTIITPQELQSTSFNTSYLPAFNASLPILNKSNPMTIKNFSNPILPADPVSNAYLLHLIDQQKLAENNMPSKLNKHDIHHYVFNSLMFTCLVVFFGAFVAHYKGYSVTKWFKKSNRIPITPKDTIYSIPTSNRTLNEIQPAPRTTLPE